MGVGLGMTALGAMGGMPGLGMAGMGAMGGMGGIGGYSGPLGSFMPGTPANGSWSDPDAADHVGAAELLGEHEQVRRALRRTTTVRLDS